MAAIYVNLASSWTGGFKGTGIIEGDDFNIKIGIPESLGGNGEGANPKELFVAAIASCFLSTLAAISDGKKLPVHSLSVSTESSSDDHHFSITHTVKIKLPSSSSQENIQAAHKIIQVADDSCVLGNLAKKSGVTIEIIPVIDVQAS